MSVFTGLPVPAVPAAPQTPCTRELVERIKEADQDFEWYPTTDKMLACVAAFMPPDTSSILDIGAGDGLALVKLAETCKRDPELFSIELSDVLRAAQPRRIVPVGTDFLCENLACLPVDVLFCNPPYSAFESWASVVIESGHARTGFLVIPGRWRDSKQIKAAAERRGAKLRVIHTDTFHNAERRARATINIVQVDYPTARYGRNDVLDPFDIWFENNIDTFDRPKDITADPVSSDLEKTYADATIAQMVEGYNAAYQRMEDNYRAIFELDYALLQELGIEKDAVRSGIKKKMAGLKNKYWKLLFNRLDAITRRLSTRTRERFLEKLTARCVVEFTTANARAIVIWAIKNANAYYDRQIVELFRDLTTVDGVTNYKSNQKTWEKNGWRYCAEDHSRYILDYRFIVEHYHGINHDRFAGWDYPNGLYVGCHNQLADIIAVFSNFGYTFATMDSKTEGWVAGRAVKFKLKDGRVLFEAKAHLNGNIHYRFMPEAMKHLNIEAGRLLGWLQNPTEAATETGCTEDEAKRFYGTSLRIEPQHVPLLTTGG